MAQAEMRDVPEMERELLGMIARKLTNSENNGIPVEKVWVACKGKPLLIGSQKIVDKTTLEAMLNSLTITTSSRDELATYLKKEGYHISRQSDPEIVDDAEDNQPTNNRRTLFFGALVVIVGLLLAILGATYHYGLWPNRSIRTAEVKDPPTPIAKAVAPVVAVKSSVDRPIGQQLHELEDKVSHQQADQTLINRRLEGIKHDLIDPVRDLALKHEIQVPELKRRVARLEAGKRPQLKPSTTVIWELRGVPPPRRN